MDLNDMRYRVEKAERELMPETRLEAFEQMQNNIQVYIQSLEEKKIAEEKAFDQEVEQLKPKTSDVAITDKEREKSPELVLLGNRKLDSKNVAVMNYLTKTVISRLSAEVDTPEDFLSIIEELANNEDHQMIHVFLDSFHEILQVGKSLPDYRKVEYEVKQLYKLAKDNVKSPEQLRYEAALQEAKQNKSRLFSRYLPEEKNINDFLNELNIKISFLKDEVTGSNPKNVW